MRINELTTQKWLLVGLLCHIKWDLCTKPDDITTDRGHAISLVLWTSVKGGHLSLAHKAFMEHLPKYRTMRKAAQT